MTRTMPTDPDVLLDLNFLVKEGARRAGVNVNVFLGRKRRHLVGFCEIRDAAIHEAVELGISYPQIGWVFNRDHTSCICAARRHRERAAQR